MLTFLSMGSPAAALQAQQRGGSQAGSRGLRDPLHGNGKIIQQHAGLTVEGKCQRGAAMGGVLRTNDERQGEELPCGTSDDISDLLGVHIRIPEGNQGVEAHECEANICLRPHPFDDPS